MKRRTFAESDGEGQSSDSEEKLDKRPRVSVSACAASSGFDCGPMDVTCLVDAHPSAPSSNVNNEKQQMRRSMDVPPTVDQTFLRQLFGKTSKFPSRILEETGCTVAVESNEDVASLVQVRGDSVASVEAAVARIRGLFRLPPTACNGLLQQFTQLSSVSHTGASERVETKRLDLVNLDAGRDRGEKMFRVPDAQIPYVMTVQSKQAISEATGAEVEWEPPNARLLGTGVQIAKAEKMLLRVTKHCLWGASAAKVMALLRPMKEGSVRVRLTPMSTLKSFEAALTGSRKAIKMGKGSENDIIVSDTAVSRKHCVLEFDTHRGGVYIYDLSTNGTFLNGRRLPDKKYGKVMVMHGDEVLLKNPEHGDGEFGYIVNLQQVY